MNIFLQELARDNIEESTQLSRDGLLKVEDNVGEAIHVHYENVRLEMSISEFTEFSTLLGTAKEELDGNH